VRRRKSLVIALTIYSRPGCHLCTDMKLTVERIVRDMDAPARIEIVDIANDPTLEAHYGLEIPVLLVNGRKAAKHRVTERELRRVLTAAGQRDEG
jgi:glutaredoxin